VFFKKHLTYRKYEERKQAKKNRLRRESAGGKEVYEAGAAAPVFI